MSYVFRTLIVADAQAPLARTLSETLAGPPGANMWTVPLSPTGEEPPTHWESTGWLSPEFASLMPLVDWEQDADGVWVATPVSAGDAALVADLATQAGLTVSEADVQAVFDASDCTMQEWPTARARLGLQAIVAPLEQL